MHILSLQDRSLFLPLPAKALKGIGKAVDYVTRKPVKMSKCEGGVVITLDKVPDDIDKVVEIAL